MKLNLILHDTNCSAFLGIVEALQLMENDVVAVIDPQNYKITSGWVFLNNEKSLRIAMPNRVNYLEYATKDKGPLGVKGYCIDVFEDAVKLLPYVVPHTYMLYGNGLRNPSYNNLVNDVAENLFRESIVSTLGCLVLILWFIVVLIINSSYTASLTSILMVQQLTSNIKGIDSLITSTNSIGVQDGSFAYNYLEEYVDALHKGPKVEGVAAIVDELPYIELLLYKINCKFRIVGQEFTKSGWGFVFQRDSPLVMDLLTAILLLSKNGDPQRIHNRWLSLNRCSAQANQVDENILSLTSFCDLFPICGTTCFLALTIFFYKLCWQYHRYTPKDEEQDIDELESVRPKSTWRMTSFKDFDDKKEDEVMESIKRKSDNKRQASQRSYGHPSSPSR
ncbi:unnamed protein product [Camellia sinensis]